MALTQIRQLYVAELSELYESEEEILRQLPLMATRAVEQGLREIFESHYRDTQRHRDRLTTIFAGLDERRRPTSAPAIRGLIEEARVRQASLERGDLLDLALVDAGRRIEHYEIAAYSATLGYARLFGDMNAAALLIETLDEERSADSRLEAFATSSRLTAA